MDLKRPSGYSGINVIEVTKSTFWLHLRPTPQDGAHALYCKSSQEPMAEEEVIGPRGEPTSIVLLNGIKLPFKHTLIPIH